MYLKRSEIRVYFMAGGTGPALSTLVANWPVYAVRLFICIECR